MALLKYPLKTIYDTTDYFRLDLIKFESSSGTRTEGGLLRSSTAFSGSPSTTSETLTNTILLPMPSNIQDGNSVSYADDSLNGYAAAAVAGVTEAMGAGNAIADPKGGAQQFGQGLKQLNDLITDPGVQRALNRYFAASAVNIFGANVTPDQLLARETGQIFNPNMELLFNGVTLRSFKFSFKMTPRSEDEAKQISKILKELKKWMAPRVDSNKKFLKSPHVFQPYFMKGSGIHPYLNLIKMSALTDISVNYTGENVYATYHDGSPVSYILDLTFKELEPIYNSDYDSPINNIGF